MATVQMLVLDPRLDGAIRPLARGTAVAQGLALLLLAYLVWRWSVRAPLERLFARRRQRRPAARARSDEQLRALSEENQKRLTQLHSMMQMNRSLRDKLSRLGAEHAAALRARDAALGISQDAILLTDAVGAVTGVSSATATLLRSPRESLVGKRFEDIAPLFVDGVGAFRDHPLRNFLSAVTAAPGGIPQIRQAVLVNHENEPVPVFVTASAIIDGNGQSLGCAVRFSRADAPAPEPSAGPALSLADAQIDAWSSKLLSREPFERRLDELVADAVDNNIQHALIYARVDELDRINDQAGYWAGEQALWHAAKNFAMALTDAGSGYRPSNSRFAALLVGSDLQHALRVAERIRAHAQANELVWNGKRIACTFSIAVLPIARSGGTRAQLLGQAETLLAEAKNRGGNRVLHEVPADAPGARRRDDQAWLDWLTPRLEDGRAHLISQELRPLADASHKPLVEFFLRVEDDDGVWLEPGYYLPAVERLQQSHRVDLWTLRHLLRVLENHPELLETHAMVSLNLASQSLLNPEFAASAFEIIGNSPVDTERLCFEIDEGFAVGQSSVLQRFIEQLRPLGVRFAIDRCHTTTGITQLRHLPIDYMKIHPSVTRNIESDALDRAHLKWICEAAHLLGRRTCAINVESEGAMGALRDAGVDFVQGTAVNKIGPMMT
ncbi:EAL domain-containing protein [Sinimarinibacterium sp. HSW-8]|uniref:EAL domain-containing protein n=2 Tax=Sinimarinibacterium thermocellulolyticum TaxID=3170016 RepID=A0ABV2A985_9GAMM